MTVAYFCIIQFFPHNLKLGIRPRVGVAKQNESGEYIFSGFVNRDGLDKLALNLCAHDYYLSILNNEDKAIDWFNKLGIVIDYNKYIMTDKDFCAYVANVKCMEIRKIHEQNRSN